MVKAEAVALMDQ
jgi:hypothetical protein